MNKLQNCKTPIGTKSFIPREQDIYCTGCYEDKFATRCVKCKKVIFFIAILVKINNLNDFIYLGNYNRRCYLQKWAMASWVLHMHKLWDSIGGSTIHEPRRKAILRWLLRWIVCEALHGVYQTHYRWDKKKALFFSILILIYFLQASAVHASFPSRIVTGIMIASFAAAVNRPSSVAASSLTKTTTSFVPIVLKLNWWHLKKFWTKKNSFFATLRRIFYNQSLIFVLYKVIGDFCKI